MTRALIALLTLIGGGLIFAAGTVLADDVVVPAEVGSPATSGQPIEKIDGPGVRMRDVLLVVNRDGSAAVGAHVRNVREIEVALMGVVVSIDGQRLPVNATEMWLPVPVEQQTQVGAASDAGGFVVPRGVTEATRADVEFRFDDGTCVLAEVTAVARTNEHRWVYPRSGRAIGPVTTDEPPGGISCSDERRDAARVAE